jgi:hypothetical protein
VLLDVAKAAPGFLTESRSPNEALNGERRYDGDSASPGFDGCLANLRNRNDVLTDPTGREPIQVRTRGFVGT